MGSNKGKGDKSKRGGKGAAAGGKGKGKHKQKAKNAKGKGKGAAEAAPAEGTSGRSERPRRGLTTTQSPESRGPGSTPARATNTPAGDDIPSSEAVIREWGRRVEAEYRSAAITQHLTLWLIQMAASPDLIHDGLRIVADELAHADLSFQTFVAAGGKAIAPIPRESLALPLKPGEQLEEAVTRWGVEVFCLGETVAVPLFKVLREGCVVPTAREALDRVLRDEVRHRDFGWTLLEYLVETPHEPLVRAVVERELPGMFARLQRNYAPVGGEASTAIPETDRAWGLMPIARYRQILDRTLERDYQPRFLRLGFEIDAAWEKATALRRAAS